MRRQPGEGLRNRLRERAKRTRRAVELAMLNVTWYVGVAFGFAVAALLSVAGSYLSRPEFGSPLTLLATAVMIVGWGYIVGKKHRARVTSDRRRTENIEKGLDAETRIGDSIDYAIVARGCAVAHNVKKIAKVGDIDHIVLTPTRRLWVVETKSGRVPPSEFPKVLDRIAANVEAARKWEPDADVQGYLALASDDKFRGMPRRARGEKILVGGRDLLLKKLRDEARAQQDVDDGLVQRVWDLGKKDPTGRRPRVFGGDRASFGAGPVACIRRALALMLRAGDSGRRVARRRAAGGDDHADGSHIR